MSPTRTPTNLPAADHTTTDRAITISAPHRGALTSSASDTVLSLPHIRVLPSPDPSAVTLFHQRVHSNPPGADRARAGGTWAHAGVSRRRLPHVRDKRACCGGDRDAATRSTGNGARVEGTRARHGGGRSSSRHAHARPWPGVSQPRRRAHEPLPLPLPCGTGGNGPKLPAPVAVCRVPCGVVWGRPCPRQTTARERESPQPQAVELRCIGPCLGVRARDYGGALP